MSDNKRAKEKLLEQLARTTSRYRGFNDAISQRLNSGEANADYQEGYRKGVAIIYQSVRNLTDKS